MSAIVAALALVMSVLLSGATTAWGYPGATTRVSVDSEGAQGDGRTHGAAISGDGRYVAFHSDASNLVPGDGNGATDVFVHDRQAGATSRVSVDSTGGEGDRASLSPAISAEGRYLAFGSSATNLVGGDTNGGVDVFVHDRQTGATSRVSVDSNGTQANSNSFIPAISADGRYVAFDSFASNLVAGDTNRASDVFVHDRQTGATSRVSVDSAGDEGNGYSRRPRISADGRYVAFHSFASNLVAGDRNGTTDVFVHDRQTGATSRVSVDSAGAEGNGESTNPAISADGSLVAFDATATNLVPGDTNRNPDVFVHDRQTGATSRVSVDSAGAEGNGHSRSDAISADGQLVAFHSSASNLVHRDTNGQFDVFVHDLLTGTTSRVSVDSTRTEGNGRSDAASISGDGNFVAFPSLASNLVAGDTNGASDVFVHEARPTPPRRPPPPSP